MMHIEILTAAMPMAAMINPNLRGTESDFSAFLLSHTEQQTSMTIAVRIASITRAYKQIQCV